VNFIFDLTLMRCSN